MLFQRQCYNSNWCPISQIFSLALVLHHLYPVAASPLGAQGRCPNNTCARLLIYIQGTGHIDFYGKNLTEATEAAHGLDRVSAGLMDGPTIH